MSCCPAVCEFSVGSRSTETRSSPLPVKTDVFPLIAERSNRTVSSSKLPWICVGAPCSCPRNVIWVPVPVSAFPKSPSILSVPPARSVLESCVVTWSPARRLIPPVVARIVASSVTTISSPVPAVSGVVIRMSPLCDVRLPS